MAEPARRLNDGVISRSVYDEPSGTAPSDPRPDLKAIEGGGETTEPKRGHLSEAGNEGPSRDELSDAETNAFTPEHQHENQVGSGYQPGSDLADRWGRGGYKPTLKSLGSFFIHNRRNTAIGGIVAAIIIIIIFALVTLLPLKILHIVNNLQSKFYATSENAVQKETGQLFSQYIRSGLRNCRGTIDKNCNPIPATSNPVTRLFKGWQNARLENKLSTNYGIEFGYSHGNYLLKAPGLADGGLNINEFVNNNSGESLDDFLAKSTSADFTKVNRSQIRQAVKDSLSNETRWKRVMYRFKVGRLLEEKYGIRRCIVFCGVTDPLADKVDSQKRAAKLFLAERIIQPRGALLGVALECLYNPQCSPTDTAPTQCTPDTCIETNGAPENPETDTTMRTTLDSLAAKYGIEDIAALEAIYTQISEKGLQSYLIEKALAGIIGDSAAKEAAQNLSKALPIVGWVSFAAAVVNLGSKADSKVKKLDYLVNSGSAVQTWSMYRTYADEVNTGQVKATEVGSFTNSLSPGDQTDGNGDKQLGGTAGAEATPLYNNLISDKTSGSTAYLGPFNDKAYAASSSYLCNDGKPIPAGSLICNEEKLGVGNGYTKTISDFFNSPEMAPVRLLANVWNSTGGKILNKIGGIIGGILNLIPGYSSLEALIADAVKPLMNYVINFLIPNPFSENMSGGRTFDMIAAGADVSGNDYAHNGIGGQLLSDQQVTAILDEQNQQDLQHYKNESFFARMFDKESNYSPVTKLAMAIPSSTDGARLALASWFTNPFTKISSSISSLFGPKLAFAAAGTQPDPFGVVQYGYPTDDPRLAEANKNPQAYWDAHCADGSQTLAWNQDASGNVNDTTGMPTNSYTNPCLLIQTATGSAGAIYDSGLLTPDDLAGSSQDSGSSSQAGPIITVSGNLQSLAKQILANPNITYPLDAVSLNGSTKAVLQAVAGGQPAPVTCQDGSAQGITSADLNPNILSAILDMAQGGTRIGVNALTDKCHSTGSNHYKGLAVDFECRGVPFDINRNDAIAAKYGGLRNFETCSNNYHWHYDFLTRP